MPDGIDPAQTMAALACVMFTVGVLRTAVLGVMWRAERAPHLAWWTAAFALQAASQAAAAAGGPEPGPLAAGTPFVLLVASALAQLEGAARFAGTTRLRGWVPVGLAALTVSGASLAAGLPFTLAATAPLLFLAAAQLVTASTLLGDTEPSARLARWVAAGSLAANALHGLDYPWLGDEPWFLPWGLALAVVLELPVTFALVGLHYHRAVARRDAVEARLSALARAIGVGVVRTTADGRLLEADQGLATLLGYATPAEVLALDLRRDVYVDPAERDTLRASSPGPTVHGTARWRRKDGRPLVVRVHGTRSTAPDGTERYDGFVVDETAVHALEEELRQAHKLEAVGRLAGGVAHDVNNLLTVVRSALDEVAGAPGLGPEHHAALGDAGDAVSQGAALTRRLLAFARTEEWRPRPVDVAAAVRRATAMITRTFGPLHRVTVEDLAPGAALLDEGDLEQIVVNLLVNARDAQPDGGPIAVRLKAAAQDGVPGLHLEVTDAGVGLSVAEQQRVFDPFYTTKPAGRGTGLGLSTVHGIVTRAGGRIAVDSTPGRGSTFRIWLPTCPPAPAPAAPPPAPVHPGERRRVLVVDDEPEVRAAVARIARGLGHDVDVAASGEDALRLAADAAPFDVVVCDVRMPGLDGWETVARLRAGRPALRVVLMSGFDGDPRSADVPPDAFLRKPFGRDDLAAALA